MSRIEISIKEQRGYLLVRGALAMTSRSPTGKKSHPTPTGSFTVRAKEKDYHSNLYGKIFDSTGLVLVEDADSRVDKSRRALSSLAPPCPTGCASPIPAWASMWDMCPAMPPRTVVCAEG